MSAATTIPTGVFSQRFKALFPLSWSPGLCSLSHSPVVPPSLSAQECGTTSSASHHLAWSTSCCLAASPLYPQLPISTPPTGLDECFLNSLVVGLPYSLIFWQFWLFFVFKLVVILLLVVQGSKEYLPMPLSWLEVYLILLSILNKVLIK